ncbi:uracil-DNA glycosylase [uncultured Enterovirga sp.]|uniref:uracil-DNA glycosylase n=1 Tax=uncultured Enterovirga sp. TaxID=2026352 RepID=UPI0035CA2C77
MSGPSEPLSERPVATALARLREDAGAEGWCSLPFFKAGEADRIAAALDAAVASGADLAPRPDHIFRALSLTPLDTVRAVILGQDPYPRRGDAHGLAFSFVGARAMPPSLRVVLAELAADQGCPVPPTGDLTGWAREGVLLLNTALTTLVGAPGAHLKLGWAALADEVVAAVSARRPAVAFLLWGASARSRAALIDADRHLVIESGHPSPLNRARDFPGSRPFSRANAWLVGRGMEPVHWASSLAKEPR